jgi:hypothetical protein
MKRSHDTASSDVPAIMGGLFELLEHNVSIDRPTHDPLFLILKKKTGLRSVLGLIYEMELGAGEGFLLAEKRVIRRPVLITQTFTSSHIPAQSLCRNDPLVLETQKCLDERDGCESGTTTMA